MHRILALFTLTGEPSLPNMALLNERFGIQYEAPNDRRLGRGVSGEKGSELRGRRGRNQRAGGGVVWVVGDVGGAIRQRLPDCRNRLEPMQPDIIFHPVLLVGRGTKRSDPSR